MRKETGRIHTYKLRKWLSVWEGRQMGDRDGILSLHFGEY